MAQYNYRFLARVLVEAQTSFSVGSGEDNSLTDSLVVTDTNGLPYIPGTTLAGVLRHLCSKYDSSHWGGTRDEVTVQGSRIVFTSAQLTDGNSCAVDTLREQPIREDPFLSHFLNLPIRQHVKIGQKGVAEDGAKYDEQVVFKGSRFCFEIEMLSSDKDLADDKIFFRKLLAEIGSDLFSLGKGVYRGLGEFKVIGQGSGYAVLNLTIPRQLELYLGKSTCLSDSSFWEKKQEHILPFPEEGTQADWDKYELTLEPEDFFLFGSGEADEESDMTPVREKMIKWNGMQGDFIDQALLIPASSLKGALVHRTAFHYNKKIKRFADHPSPDQENENEAVAVLFGSNKEPIRKGNVILRDIISVTPADTRILQHVSIDRFTGGAIQGALFTEKVIHGKGQQYKTTLLINKEAIRKMTTDPSLILEAFRLALADLLKGMLPIGGGVNRGNGCFTGKCNPEFRSEV